MTSATTSARAALPPRLLTAALAALLSLLLVVPAGATSTVQVASDGLWEVPAAGWPEPVDVPARAWVLVDVPTGQVLASRDQHDPRPPASTTKMLTALAVVRHVGLDEVVTVSAVAAGQAGASTGIRAGDRILVRDLLALLLLRSGNDAAVALAEHTAGSLPAFADLLRREAAVLGLERLVLAEPHGLDDRNRLSARQLAVIGRAVLAHDVLRPLVAADRWTLTTGRTIENRNELLGEYPGATGLKTGMTTAAGWSLVASARRGPRHLVAVVLGAPDDASRFEAARRLLDHGFDQFALAPPAPSLRVRADARWLEVAATTPRVLLPVGATSDLVPSLPVEPVDPTATWRWGSGGGRWDQPATLREALPEARVAPLVGAAETTDGGSGRLGAWLSGRVQASLRAATVAGLWEE